MENASKAILIAGAVIVTLLVISLGLYFYNQSIGIVDIFGNKITSTDIRNHNNSFLIYDGELMGVEVINACIKIKEYNVNTTLPITVNANIGGSNYTFTYNDSNNFSGYQNILNKIVKDKVYIGETKLDNRGVISEISFKLKN